jgi:hypothetical protein
MKKMKQIINYVKMYNVSKEEFDLKNLIWNDDKELKKIEVVDDYNNILKRIFRNRLSRSTLNNPDSSRSHLFVTLHMFDNDDDDDEKFKIVFADLAGSEDPHAFSGRAA